jgi:hypothetical protein
MSTHGPVDASPRRRVDMSPDPVPVTAGQGSRGTADTPNPTDRSVRTRLPSCEKRDPV